MFLNLNSYCQLIGQASPELNELVGRARFFELLGYALAVAAFAILACGLIWMLGRRFTGRFQIYFLVVSWLVVAAGGVAAFLWLVASNPMPQPGPALRRGPRPAEPLPSQPPETWQELTVQLAADGQVFVDGQPVEPAAVVEAWQEAHAQDPQLRLHVILQVDPATPLGKLVETQDAFQQAGIDRFTIRSEK